MRFVYGVMCVVGFSACGFQRPMELPGDAAGGNDTEPSDAGGGPVDGSNEMDGGGDASANQFCIPNQPLRCDRDAAVHCNGDGTAEVSESCSLGCNGTEKRCDDVAPSNGLAPYLDMTASEPGLDLGTTATINTDDGTVTVDGNLVSVRSVVISQAAGPVIRILMVRSLQAKDVTVTGSNALAVASNGDVTITGVFAASAHHEVGGPGRFNDSVCQGRTGASADNLAIPGSGGGGFGSQGGDGGNATNVNGTAVGAKGGSITGNPSLIPLRGGCDAGPWSTTSAIGGGGGAVQIVSRTRISVVGVLAANGSSYSGGGSGGGILLEAPIVAVPGSLVANGGAGADTCLLNVSYGEDGRLDAMPARGGMACDPAIGSGGGNGGARNDEARPGNNLTVTNKVAIAGNGGGGVGRIRINTVSGGVDATGIISPNPSTGTIATR